MEEKPKPGRRLAACKSLGWKEIPVRIIVSLDDAVLALVAEFDENTCREPLSIEGSIKLGRKLEEMEKPKAAERQAKAGPTSGRGRKTTGSSDSDEPVGRTDEKVASALGMGRDKYRKAKAVDDAAKADPETFGDLPAKMEETEGCGRKQQGRRQSRRPPPAPEPIHGHATSVAIPE